LPLLLLTGIVLLISVPRKFFNTRTYQALLSLPTGFILMFLSLIKIRGAGSRFIHTTHSHTEKVNKKAK